MSECIIHGEAMLDRATAHAELARALGFPEYYGRNLDALWDLLTEMDAEAVFTDRSGVLERLGEYGEAMISTIEEAAAENSGLHIRFIETEDGK